MSYDQRYKTKYGNVRQTYGGYNYDSKFEASVAQDLDTQISAGAIKSYKRQVTIPLRAYGRRICNYRIDFVVTHNDETLEYLEAKGFATDLWKIKWKLLEAQLGEEEPTASLTVIYNR